MLELGSCDKGEVITWKQVAEFQRCLEIDQEVPPEFLAYVTEWTVMPFAEKTGVSEGTENPKFGFEHFEFAMF